jgi:hypothetical protein
MKIKPIINTASAGRPLRVIASKRTKNVYSARRIGDSSQIARQRVAQTDVLYDAMKCDESGFPRKDYFAAIRDDGNGYFDD